MWSATAVAVSGAGGAIWVFSADVWRGRGRGGCIGNCVLRVERWTSRVF